MELEKTFNYNYKTLFIQKEMCQKFLIVELRKLFPEI